MFRKDSNEGRSSATDSSDETTPSRASATGTLGAVPRREASTEGVGARTSQKLSEVKDATKERLDRAGEHLGEAARDAKERAREVGHEAKERAQEALQDLDIEEFKLRGNFAGHPFRIDIEDEDQSRYLSFELTFNTDDGDHVRISGRKNLAHMGRGRAPEEHIPRSTGTGMREGFDAEVPSGPSRPQENPGIGLPRRVGPDTKPRPGGL